MSKPKKPTINVKQRFSFAGYSRGNGTRTAEIPIEDIMYELRSMGPDATVGSVIKEDIFGWIDAFKDEETKEVVHDDREEETTGLDSELLDHTLEDLRKLLESKEDTHG